MVNSRIKSNEPTTQMDCLLKSGIFQRIKQWALPILNTNTNLSSKSTVPRLPISFLGAIVFFSCHKSQISRHFSVNLCHEQSHRSYRGGELGNGNCKNVVQ